MGGFLKALVLIALTAIVFGGGGYYTYSLFVKPEVELQREKDSPVPLAPAFEDSTIGEFQKCAQVEAAGDPLAARSAYLEFLETYPDSSKAEEARFRVGAIQLGLLFTPRMTPGKQAYVVKQGDVMNKICSRLKIAPDLLMAINHLESSNLRIGQRLYWMPSQFSAVIDRPGSKVMILQGGDFFAQVPVISVQGNARVGAIKKGAQAVVSVKVSDKPGWKDGQRVASTDKGYADSLHWIVFQPGGHTLYAEPGAGVENVPRPTSGYGLAPDVVRQLSALLRKNETVTIR
ncbi:MAG: LysM peptidoglycan-binding domain-containing protein [Verrucomicrobiota bacterium]